MRDVATGFRHHCRRGQETDSRNRQQYLASRAFLGRRREPPPQIGDALFQQADWSISSFIERGTARPNSRQKPHKALMRDARTHPKRTYAAQPLLRLLLNRLDADRFNVRAAGRFEQGAGAGGIGLVALHAGPDVRRQ